LYKDLNKIAITGFSGAIGKEFPKQCARLKTRLQESCLTMYKELNNIPNKIDTLIHLSGMVSIKECNNNPQLAYKLNVIGSLKWYLAAEMASIKKFIFVSTSHVYGIPLNNEIIINTNYKPRPNNVYGETKLLAENILRKQSKKKNKTKLLIARVFSIISKYGREYSLTEGLKKRSINIDYSEIEGFYNKRDFLTSKEVVKNLIKLRMSNSSRLITNICSGKAKTIGDIACKIFAEANLDKKELIKNNLNQLQYKQNCVIGRPTLF
jgi:nucleoside-diphosphate-sugar epimerase